MISLKNCTKNWRIQAGFLAKRTSKTAPADISNTGHTVPARVYAPLDEESAAAPKLSPKHAGIASQRKQEDSRSRKGSGTNKPSMLAIFGPGGFLDKSMIGGYEHRPAQLQMAEAIDDAFENHHHAILEAGTGTGKTLAYLLPAITSGRRVVVSTATKSLQEQLYLKDVPFLQKHFAPNWKVAVMKGRSNFLCLAKAHAMADQPVLKGMEEFDAFRQIQDWSKLTETGDRAELTFLPDDSDLWSRIDARRDTCTGKKCPQFNQCFLTRMQTRAKEADLIIVNHHLFFADLALKHDDFGSILPEYSAVVFDSSKITNIRICWNQRRVACRNEISCSLWHLVCQSPALGKATSRGVYTTETALRPCPLPNIPVREWTVICPPA